MKKASKENGMMGSEGRMVREQYMRGHRVKGKSWLACYFFPFTFLNQTEKEMMKIEEGE